MELKKETVEKLINIYEKYVLEASNPSDINRWCTKKTITKAVFESERTNEVKVREAIEGEYLYEGDKIWVYPGIVGYTEVQLKTKVKYEPKRVLKLVKNYDNDADTNHLRKRVYNTALILSNVVDKQIFLNYSLTTKKKQLEKLLAKNS